MCEIEFFYRGASATGATLIVVSHSWPEIKCHICPTVPNHGAVDSEKKQTFCASEIVPNLLPCIYICMLTTLWSSIWLFISKHVHGPIVKFRIRLENEVLSLMHREANLQTLDRFFPRVPLTRQQLFVSEVPSDESGRLEMLC
jgi:hypothetical protein